MKKIDDKVLELDLREIAIEDCKQYIQMMIDCTSNKTLIRDLIKCLQKLDWNHTMFDQCSNCKEKFSKGTLDNGIDSDLICDDCWDKYLMDVHGAGK